MLLSFTDRVLGGVCGGLASALRVDAWLIRALFAVLAVASLGGFGVLYLILWWITPQELPTASRQRGVPVALVFLMMGFTGVLWIGRDQTWLRAASGESLYLPLLVFVLAVVFFLRQIRA